MLVEGDEVDVYKRLLVYLLVVCMLAAMLSINVAASGDVPITIVANDYKEISSGITENKPSWGMNLSSYAEYDISSYTGLYGFKVLCAANNAATLKLIIDGRQYGEFTIAPTNWSTFKECESELVVNITEDMKTLRMQVAGTGGVLRLKEIYLHDKLAGLIYKDHILNKLNGVTDDTICQKAIDEEENNPLVTIADNKVKIGSGVGKTMTAIAALYDGNELVEVKYKETSPYQETSLDGFSASVDENDLKIFFWDGFDNLKPIELNYSNIYVSPSGDDSATGFANAPVKTITKAKELVRERNEQFGGDITVHLAEGEYPVTDTLVFDENDGGQENGSVTWRSMDKENPAVLTGGADITEKWQPYPGNTNIYTVQIPDVTDVRQLYINDYPAQRARSGYVYLAAESWDDTETAAYAEDGFIVKDDSFPILTKPKYAEICYKVLWTVQRLPVKTVELQSGQHIVKMKQPYYSEAITMVCAGMAHPQVGSQFYIENDLSLLDSPGEFYFDKDTSTMYYYPLENEDLDTAKCVVAKTQYLMTGGGASLDSKMKNLTFDGIGFRYGAYTEANVKGAVSFQAECLVDEGLNSNPISTGRILPAQISFTNTENLSFANCDISCMGSTAISYGEGVSNSKITGCVLRDNGGSAISIGSFLSVHEKEKVAQNITVENNVVARPGIDFLSSPGISIYYSNGIQVKNNDIFDTPYSGISLGWGWGSNSSIDTSGNHLIEGNRIQRISQIVFDGGHIYMLSRMDGTVVKNNYLSDSTDYGGIYFDTGSGGITVERNVIEKSTNWLFGGRGNATNSDGNPALNANQNITINSNYVDDKSNNTTYLANANMGRTYTEPTVYPDSEWSGEALTVVNSSGVTDVSMLEKAKLPAGRDNLHFNVPMNEYVKSTDRLIEAENCTEFYPNSGNVGKKTKPNLYYNGKRVFVGNLMQDEKYVYTVNVSEGGEYDFELRYNSGNDYKAHLYVGNTKVLNGVTLPKTFLVPNTTSTLNSKLSVPYIMGTITLASGENKITFEPRNGFTIDSFKLIKK